MSRAVTLSALVAVGFALGWWGVFTVEFLLGIVPHGGAW